MTARAFVIWITFALPGRLIAQNVSEVQVAPPTVTVKVGERSGLLATAFDRAGNVIPTVRFIWSSNNVSVARVDNDGTVTGVAGGVAIVEARVPPPRHGERGPERRDRRVVRGPGDRAGDELAGPHRHRAGGGAAKRHRDP